MARKIGLISLPGWDDPTATELSSIILDEITVQKALLADTLANHSLDSLADSDDALIDAARNLAENGCDIVACVGTTIGWAGQANTNSARLRASRITRKAGVRLVMTGTAIIDMLGLLGAHYPALACTYHPQQWKNAWHHYVFNTGFDVTIAQNFHDAGLASASTGPNLLRNPSPDLIAKAIVRIAADAPKSDAIVVTGAGARTLGQIHELEDRVGMPVLGSDIALYGALALAGGFNLVPGCLGRLSEYLMPSASQRAKSQSG